MIVAIDPRRYHVISANQTVPTPELQLDGTGAPKRDQTPLYNLHRLQHQQVYFSFTTCKMLEWFFASSELLVSIPAPLAAASCVLVAIVIVAFTGALQKPKQPFGTREPHRLKTSLPFFGSTVEMMRAVSHIHDWSLRNMESLNFEPYRILTLGTPLKTALASPEAFEDVFKTHFDAFPKGDFQTGNLQDLLGNGIFAVDGEKWAAQRKTASRLFTMRALRDSMTSTIQKHSVVLHEIFERASTSGEPIDLFKLFNRFTIEAFAEIGFGVTMGCLDSEEEHPFQSAFDGAQRRLVLRFIRPNWLWKAQRLLGIGAEGQLRRELDVINTTVLDIIHKSMAHRHRSHQAVDLYSTEGSAEESKNDIVSLFLDNYATIMGGDSSAPFDPIFLRDIVINFLIAGRDTTAQALSWFFYCLDQNPRVADRIREELAEKLPELFDRTKSSIPSMEHVSRLVYLEAALKETLRLYPSVPVSTKDAVRDVVLSDGTPIPKGSTVMLLLYAMGRNPNVWGPDAKEFKPERWLDTSSKEPKIVSASAFKFIAFNAGPRMCLGMNLAMLEMKLIVASVLSRFRVKLTHPEDVTYDVSLTLPVKGELSATIERLE